jgi:cytochrome c556
MGQLRGLTFERLPQELDRANQERARLEEASSIASALAQGADRIQGTVEEIQLSQDAREVFLKLADRLREGALKLSSQASQGQTHLVDSTMKEIRATCVDCHHLFRSPIGAPRNRFLYPTVPF